MNSKKKNKIVSINKIYKERLKKKSFTKTFKIALMLIIVVAIIFKAYSFLVSLPKTQTVSWGTLENSVSGEALVLREEVLVTAPKRGFFYPRVEQGTRVREGQIIGDIKSVIEMEDISYPVKVGNAGIIGYELDGLEKLLNPSNLKDLDIEKIKDLKRKEKTISEGKEVYKGEPIAKITNNFSPVVFIVSINEENYNLLKGYKDKSIQIEISEHFFEGTILNLNKNFLIIKVLNWDKQFLNKRDYTLKLILDSATGYIIPKSAIFKKEDKDGIFIYNGKGYSWRSVKILGKKEEDLIIDGLEYDVPVVKNPEVLVKK